MKLAAIVLSVLLVGCASGPQVVNVPVHEPCTVEVPTKPTLRYSPPYTSTFEGVRDLLGDRALSEAYETELEAALKACR